MKRILAICLALMAALCPALAEGAEYWTSREDIYYHIDAECGNPDYRRVAVSMEAAEEFDRQPCPLCVALYLEEALSEPEPEPEPEDEPEPDAAPEGLSAAVRGGTWVFRVPKAALENMEMGKHALPDGVDDLVALFGEALTDALEARVALPADGALFMSLRVIDGDAYAVVRPEKRYKKSRPFRWQAARIVADIFKPGAYSIEGVSQVWEYAPSSKAKAAEREKAVFSEDYSDGLSVEVYRALDACIAVLHKKGVDARTGLMTLAGLPTAIPVAGYPNKKETVFCCVLTEAELQALIEGALPDIAPRAEPSIEEEAEEEFVELPDLSDDGLPMG